MTEAPSLSSTTAPGVLFATRADLAQHYKSDWHKYNLKRREAGLVLLKKEDFTARLEAAKAMREEREGRAERSGKGHLKNGSSKKKKNKGKGEKLGGAVKVSQAGAYDQMKSGGGSKDNKVAGDTADESMQDTDTTAEPAVVEEEEAPVIEPRQCLFDKHLSPTPAANYERMQRKYGFFIPDQEYLIELEGLLGYCHEKVKLGHCCLYCQRVFTTWQGCQKHMIATEHTKLKYERGVDLEEFDPFFDFSEANNAFMGTLGVTADSDDEDDNEDVGMVTADEEDDDDADWEDVTDDEAEEEGGEAMDEDETDDMYAGYKDEIARFGFDVTPLGEIVFPDGRIIGHRGLARYYKQRIAPQGAAYERASVSAARRAAGERLYKGRVYETQEEEGEHMSTLALARAGLAPGSRAGRSGNGILVAKGGGSGYTAVSLYRYKAVLKKARVQEKQGERLKNRTTCNMNKMDKKANRMMNGVSVAHALR